MDARLEANRANWNDRVAVHANSQFYDVAGWLRDAPGPASRELEALGNPAGLSLVHLQCHFGMDTLRWARVGATVTGVDFSPAAIDEATELASRAGLAEHATFVCANLYDAPQALAGQRYDVVYVSLGSLCWLPEVTGWGDVVAQLTAPGGRVYVHDVHPFTASLDDEGERVHYSYFEEPDRPIVVDSDQTYTGDVGLAATRTYEWNHSLSEIVTSLTRHGLVIDALDEHDWTVFAQFPWLEERSPGRFSISEGHPRVPLSFTLLAHARP
ncbi:MAG TPA: class I SAM-dependent methyltransferase [Acidimicrobiales bacterium]|nr:class I SAM-dependent methyltransferase [Acidimicrobiales bacterium]